MIINSIPKSSILTNSGIDNIVKIKINEVADQELNKLRSKQSKFNILLAGAKNTGKTSFTKLFYAQLTKYISKMNTRSRHGAEIHDFDLSDLAVEGSSNEYIYDTNGFKINIIDTPGYDMYDKKYHKWLKNLVSSVKERHQKYIKLSKVYFEDTNFT